MIWWSLMSSTFEASVFMGKKYSDNLHSIKNTRKDLIFKQMFDISEKLIVEQSDEILGASQISWEDSPWKQSSLVNDEEVISLSHAKVYVLSDSVLCLVKVNQNPISSIAWERQLDWFNDSKTEFWTQLMENRWNSSGIFSAGFTTLQLVHEVQKFMNKMGEPEQFQGQIIFMSMFNDIIWWIWRQWKR